MALTVTEVMLEVVTLILQGIEGLVFDLPARPPGPYQRDDIVFADGLVAHPTVVVGDLFPHLEPVLEKVDRIGIAAAVERHLIDPTINVTPSFFVG